MKNKFKQLFVSPFAYFSEKALFGVGFIFYVLSSLLVSRHGQQFNGFMHLYPLEDVSFLSVLYVQLQYILVSVALLFCIGKAINKKTRLIDILNVVLIARIPFYLLLFFSFAIDMDAILEVIRTSISTGDYELDSVSKSDMLLLTFFGIFSIFIIVYHYYLIIRGMRTATNNKKMGLNVLILALYFITDLVIQVLIS